MFRVWLSSFWRKNKEKIKQLSKLLGTLTAIGLIAGMIFSSFDITSDTQETSKEIYKPQEVTISGGEVSEKKYKEEDAVIKKFVEFCNKQNSIEAYKLLSDECKETLYPTLEDFENKYYKMIFTEKREYNIQAWINEKNYTTYRIRFTKDFMATGEYDGTEKFEDYITIVTDGENKKININGYIKTEQLNKKTKTDELQIEVVSSDIYMDYVIYTISLENLTDKDILLDSVENYNNIKLIGTNEVSYKIDSKNLRMFDLKINENEQKNIVLTFKKTHGSDVTGKTIKFTKAIMDYLEYRKDKQYYNNFKELTINL